MNRGASKEVSTAQERAQKGAEESRKWWTTFSVDMHPSAAVGPPAGQCRDSSVCLPSHSSARRRVRISAYPRGDELNEATHRFFWAPGGYAMHNAPWPFAANNCSHRQTQDQLTETSKPFVQKRQIPLQQWSTTAMAVGAGLATPINHWPTARDGCVTGGLGQAQSAARQDVAAMPHIRRD